MTSHPTIEWNGKFYKICRIKKNTVTFTQLFYPFDDLEKIIMTEDEVSKFCKENKNLLKFSVAYFPIKREDAYFVKEVISCSVFDAYPITTFNHSNNCGWKVLVVIPQ